jgi:cytosine/adenosine deaminase-related metal-dependent hydrolase
VADNPKAMTLFSGGRRIDGGGGSAISEACQHLRGRELRIKAEPPLPMEAIVSATRTNARLLNMTDRIGTLEAGKDADRIVLDGNPLEDPAIFERGRETVRLVMKAGQVMKDRLSQSERHG